MKRKAREFKAGGSRGREARMLCALALGAAFCGIAASAAAAAGKAAQTEPPDEVTHAASPGGTIHMELSAGGYTIRGTHDRRIRVHWRTRNPEDMRDVRVQVDVNGSQATISTRGPHNNFEVDIDVPSRSDLWIRLSAGELDVSGVEGNKDAEMHAGDMEINVGRVEDYGKVDASVGAGGIDAEPFRESKGGLWRSFQWQGTGKYRLHAHVGAGNLSLTSTATGRQE